MNVNEREWGGCRERAAWRRRGERWASMERPASSCHFGKRAPEGSFPLVLPRSSFLTTKNPRPTETASLFAHSEFCALSAVKPVPLPLFTAEIAENAEQLPARLRALRVLRGGPPPRAFFTFHRPWPYLPQIPLCLRVSVVRPGWFRGSPVRVAPGTDHKDTEAGRMIR